MVDYPTIIRIRYNHNHDIDVPEVAKFEDLEENVDPFWLAFSSQEKDLGNLDVEDQNDCEEMESDTVSICGEQPDSDEEEPEWEEMELIMKRITAIFKEKFEESPQDFANALSSMHKNIRTMETADLLPAMYNFGKVQHKIITASKATPIPVQQTVVSQKNSLLTHPYICKL